ncbi:MAG TPA: nucleotidyltransferase domain-containing protein [Patescibacteria group bacterium]|nr:nucleotidyltransferase domain-containing protein [Patescibacteria group bacterium]
MPNLYKITTNGERGEEVYPLGETLSVTYHDIFDFPLNFQELVRWRAGEAFPKAKTELNVTSKGGFYFLEGREGSIYKRILRARISSRKMEIAKRAAKYLAFVPGVKMVAVTGSLAMKNAAGDSDIDLMLITAGGKLWTTRFLTYLFLKIAGFAVRKPFDKNQKDKLCLNIWLDESALKWQGEENCYIAHEIGQILPLINKNETYEKLLWENKWILNFWPNSVKITRPRLLVRSKVKRGLIEKVAYRFQLLRMRSKITSEKVGQTRALFHPADISTFVLSRFST